jgi:hypothetical protein
LRTALLPESAERRLAGTLDQYIKGQITDSEIREYGEEMHTIEQKYLDAVNQVAPPG